ncbi:4-hydroxy-tetrahydrodipicolinate synthase [Ferrigenium sp. UT5]|uniref:4-hydroxy-tetrahydrodipicolinate synthase n=1 Tax=Ferrigenium sp. UT5 TaxID=3242105 RepID=UPI0038B2DE08
MITGSIVAIVTPMHEDGSLDLAAFRALIDFHIDAGTDAIVVVGTTGESPTVNVEEHELLIAEAVKHAGQRVPIIAGTGANSTREAIELATFSKKAGADASLTVVPYYNKPTQEGLYRHFKAIAEAVDMPHILYNVPGRTGCDLHNDTVLRLAEIPNIVGIKDATGGIERGSDLLQRAALLKDSIGDFAIYSGDDASTLALMLLGAHGTISVTANVAPKLMHEMCAAALRGEVARARAINFQLLGLHRKLFVEANPIPVKWAVARMGKIKNVLRLPLTPLSSAVQPQVEAAMRQAGVI